MKLLYYFKNVLLFHEKTNFKMHSIKFNVVLFHEGKYDERNMDYLLKYPLYKKCYDSVLSEFKEDNVKVYHSYDDIFIDYPEIKREINEKYLDFFNSRNALINFDLIRTLLIKYVNNLLYIDSDIYIKPGFKAALLDNISHSTKLALIQFESMGMFFSKSFSENFNLLLERFNNNYTWDIPEIKLSGILNTEDIGSISSDLQKYFSHYGALGIVQQHDAKFYKLAEHYSLNMKYEEVYTSSYNVVYFENDKIILFINNNDGFVNFYTVDDYITINDFLTTVGISSQTSNVVNNTKKDILCIMPQRLEINYCPETDSINLSRCCFLLPFATFHSREALNVEDLISFATEERIYRRIPGTEGSCLTGEDTCNHPQPQIKVVTVGISHACNLNCYHCFFTDHKDSSFQRELYFAMLEKIKGHNLDIIHMQSSGEVFFYYYKIKEYLKSLSINDTKEVNFQTNGLLLNKDRLKELKKISEETGIKYTFNFSIDAVTKETYKKVRGGDFDKLIDNILFTIALFGKENIDYSFTIKEPNKHEAIKFKDFIKNTFGYSPKGRAYLSYDYYDKSCQDLFLEIKTFNKG